jgi:hypothetical protein
MTAWRVVDRREAPAEGGLRYTFEELERAEIAAR